MRTPLWLLLVTLGGCGDSSHSVDSRVVGGACTRDTDCNSWCITGSAHYPGGLCSVHCLSDADCPAGTSCIDEQNNCAVNCTVAAGCSRFSCMEFARKGAEGSVLVCGL